MPTNDPEYAREYVYKNKKTLTKYHKKYNELYNEECRIRARIDLATELRRGFAWDEVSMLL